MELSDDDVPPWMAEISMEKDIEPIVAKLIAQREGISAEEARVEAYRIVHLGPTIIVAVVRGGERTRFYKTTLFKLHTFKQRFPDDELLYINCGGKAPSYLLTEVNPVEYVQQRGYFGTSSWKNHLLRRVDRDKPFAPKWHPYGIEEAHSELLRLGVKGAVVCSYIPEPDTDYGFMYAFEHKAMGWIKIGMTNKPDETYCWTRIRNYCEARELPQDGWMLIGVVKSSKPRKLERRIHRKLDQYRVTQDDVETELFKCGVSVYEEALATMGDLIADLKPRTTAEAVAHVEQLSALKAQENTARHQQILKAEENRKKREQRREREAKQRAIAEKQYQEKREAEQRAREIRALEEELAQFRIKEGKPKWFDFGGTARRLRIANIEHQLKVLQ